MYNTALEPSYPEVFNPNNETDEDSLATTPSPRKHRNGTIQQRNPDHVDALATERYILEKRFNPPRIPSYFVRLIETLSMQDTALSFIPARIGHDQAVDLAAHAFITLVLLSSQPGSTFRGSSNARVLRESEGQYAQAVVALRRNLNSRSSSSIEGPRMGEENAILAVYLLIVFDLLYGTRRCSYSERRVQAESHGRGLVALLKMRAARGQRRSLKGEGAVGGEAEELLRTFVYEAWSASFTGPCIRGEPSAFDCPALHNVDPPAHYGLPAPLAKLLRSGNQLIVRMPRLIAALGELRRGERMTTHLDVDPSLIPMAAELYEVRDDEGENALLHHLQVCPTMNGKVNGPALGCFFHFSRTAEFRTAMLYWSGRLMIQRIILLLSREGVDILDADRSTQHLHAQAEATATNILMCVEHGRQLGFQASKLLLNALSSVWGLLDDFPKFRNRPSSEMKLYILTSLAGIGDHVAVTKTELDFIAGSLIGGPTGCLKIPVLDPLYGI